ncbi:MAG: hypothetical protein NZZ41_03505 [Candidatus Dojkabacteria bacterium]|nr:hypothetical protein [Candidatus Dojkabacteria bacterium]
MCATSNTEANLKELFDLLGLLSSLDRNDLVGVYLIEDRRHSMLRLILDFLQFIRNRISDEDYENLKTELEKISLCMLLAQTLI